MYPNRWYMNEHLRKYRSLNIHKKVNCVVTITCPMRNDNTTFVKIVNMSLVEIQHLEKKDV